MANSRVTISAILSLIVVFVAISFAEFSPTIPSSKAAALPPTALEGSLTASLFFDGANDPRFVSSSFREPVVDSQGHLLVIADTGSISCSFGFCGYRLYSINPDGTVGWQAPTDGGFLSSDSFALRSVFLSPTDRAYVLDRGSVFAFESSGAPAIGWPVQLPYVFTGSEQPLSVDPVSGVLYTRTGVNVSFTGFPIAVVALNPDGTQKWRKDYTDGNAGGDDIVIQGPGGNIYTFVRGVGVASLDRNTGTELCSSNLNTYFGSLVGGVDGVFTSISNALTRTGTNCDSQVVFNAPGQELFLYRYADGKVFGYNFLPGSSNLSDIRLIAVGADGSFLWRNDQILPNVGGNINPIRAIVNGVVYALGRDLNDGLKAKLFLLDASTGQIINSIETATLSANPGVTVVPNGTIYLTDLTSTKIYKIAPSTDLLTYQASDYRYQVLSQGATPPSGFEQPAFDDSSWSVGSAAFGTSRGFCPIGDTIATAWPANTDLLVRRVISVPAGATDLRVFIAVDNDIEAVFFNGVQIAGSTQHENCPNLNDFEIPVPQNLVQSGNNLIAYRLRDRGDETFFDTRVTAVLPSPAPAPSPSPTPSTADLALGMTVELIKPNSNPNNVEALYRITVENKGPATATNIEVSDLLPPELTFISCFTSAGQCSGTGNERSILIPSLAPPFRESITLLTSVNTLRADVVGITNTATVSSSVPDPNLSNNAATTTTERSASISTISPTHAAPGQTLDVTVNGHFFSPGSTLSFSGGGITVNSSVTQSNRFISANISVDASAQEGSRDVFVISPNGQRAVLSNAFAVLSPLNIEQAPLQASPQQLKLLEIKAGLLTIVADEQLGFGSRFGSDPCYFGAVDAASVTLQRDIPKTALTQLAGELAAAYIGGLSTGTKSGDLLLKVGSSLISALSSQEPLAEASIKEVTDQTAGYIFKKATNEYLAQLTGPTIGPVTDKIVQQALGADQVTTGRTNGSNAGSPFIGAGAPPTSVNILIYYSSLTHYVVASVRANCGSETKTYIFRYEATPNMIHSPPSLVVIPVGN